MNRSAVFLILIGLLLLGGFLYLRSRPAPEPEVTESAIKTDQASDTSQVAGLQNINSSMANIKQYPGSPEMTIDTTKRYKTEMETTKGKITIELFADEAPITVNNFVFLV